MLNFFGSHQLKITAVALETEYQQYLLSKEDLFRLQQTLIIKEIG